MNQTTNNTQRLLWGVLVLVLLGAGIFALNGWLKEQEIRKPTQSMADYGLVPKFDLTDENGQSYSSVSLQGHIWLADLIFTNCPSSCPLMTARMASLQKSLVKTPNVKLVSFSVDPEHDTPAALKSYAKNYGADTTQWAFLTGPRSQLYPLAKEGFHLPVDSVGGDKGSPIVHSERFVLVDAKGHIRGYYNGAEEETQAKVLTAIGDLMRESK